MVSVLPLKEKAHIIAFYKKCDFPYGEHSSCVVARQGENEIGYCLFDLDSKQITVRKVFPETDIALADGILRSALHVAVCNKVINAYYSAEADENLFLKLGFVKEKGNRSLDISRLFKSCCSCADKNA